MLDNSNNSGKQKKIIDFINDYFKTYNKINLLIKLHNPCQINRNGTKLVCNYTRCIKNQNYLFIRKNSLCCYSCGHLDSYGCSVKSLACKAWLCDETTNEKLKNKLNRLFDSFEEKYDFVPYPRASFEENLDIFKKYFVN